MPGRIRLSLVIVVQQRSYRQLVAILREYEPSRFAWRVVASGALFLIAPALSIGGFLLGAYLIDGFHDGLRVAAGAIVAIGGGQIASSYVWRRGPWRVPLERGLRPYVEPPRLEDGVALMYVADEDAPQAMSVLRRAKLNPSGASRGGSPADAPELNNRLYVYLADSFRTPEDGGAGGAARVALAAAGIRARVDGLDVAAS